MSTFETIIWWYGVILFTISSALFYGLLTYGLFQYIRDKFKKRMKAKQKDLLIEIMRGDEELGLYDS